MSDSAIAKKYYRELLVWKSNESGANKFLTAEFIVSPPGGIEYSSQPDRQIEWQVTSRRRGRSYT